MTTHQLQNLDLFHEETTQTQQKIQSRPSKKRQPTNAQLDQRQHLQKVMLAVANATKQQPISAQEVASLTGLSTAQATAQLTKLAKNKFIMRKHSVSNHATGHYLYWLHEDVKETVKRATGNNTPTQGETTLAKNDTVYYQSPELRGLAEQSRRGLNLLQETEKEKERLRKQVQAQRRKLASNRASIQRYHDIIKEFKQKAATSSQQQIVNSVEGCVVLNNLNPITLSARLSFLRRLRERPALEQVPELKHIQMDYEATLKIARGFDFSLKDKD